MSSAGVYAAESRTMRYMARVTAALNLLDVPTGLPDHEYERIETAFDELLQALGRRIEATWCHCDDDDVLADKVALLFNGRPAPGPIISDFAATNSFGDPHQDGCWCEEPLTAARGWPYCPVCLRHFGSFGALGIHQTRMQHRPNA